MSGRGRSTRVVDVSVDVSTSGSPGRASWPDREMTCVPIIASLSTSSAGVRLGPFSEIAGLEGRGICQVLIPDTCPVLGRDLGGSPPYGRRDLTCDGRLVPAFSGHLSVEDAPRTLDTYHGRRVRLTVPSPHPIGRARRHTPERCPGHGSAKVAGGATPGRSSEPRRGARPDVLSGTPGRAGAFDDLRSP